VTMTAALTTVRSELGTERRRWYVHLVLLASLVGSLVSLIWLSHSITLHVVIGVMFMAVLLIHFFQRRRTIVSFAKQLVGLRARSRTSTRLAVSDVILELLVLNVLVSGIVDVIHHQATQLNFLSSVIPPGLLQWHKLAAFALVIYATVHVIRRRRRLRRSHIH
jgi:hypothetical protein